MVEILEEYVSFKRSSNTKLEHKKEAKHFFQVFSGNIKHQQQIKMQCLACIILKNS